MRPKAMGGTRWGDGGGKWSPRSLSSAPGKPPQQYTLSSFRPARPTQRGLLSVVGPPSFSPPRLVAEITAEEVAVAPGGARRCRDAYSRLNPSHDPETDRLEPGSTPQKFNTEYRCVRSRGSSLGSSDRFHAARL